MHQGNIVKKSISDFFVFYIDGILKQESNTHNIKLLNEFMEKHQCLILTKDTDVKHKYPEKVPIEKWQFNLPSPAFQKHIITDFGVRIESIIYVSDNNDFIKNSLGSFSRTVLITPAINNEDYGFIPDFIYHSIKEFVELMDTGYPHFLGEGLINKPDAMRYEGKLGYTSIKCDNRNINVVFAGRYFGYRHYRSQTDFYSLAIRKNKDKSSMLYKRFNDVFMRLFRAETKRICEIEKIDAICSIPDHSPSEYKWGRFEGIANKIAEEFSFKDIHPFLHKANTQSSQKSLINAQDRKENTKNSIIVDKNLEGKNVIIIDDILTTGSRLQSAAHALFNAGASTVICAVLGVNQFATDYWINNDTALTAFHNNYKLNGNSSTLQPFFKNLNTQKTESYNPVISNLYTQLNESMLTTKNRLYFDDDRLF